MTVPKRPMNGRRRGRRREERQPARQPRRLDAGRALERPLDGGEALDEESARVGGATSRPAFTCWSSSA